MTLASIHPVVPTAGREQFDVAERVITSRRFGFNVTDVPVLRHLARLRQLQRAAA